MKGVNILQATPVTAEDLTIMGRAFGKIVVGLGFRRQGLGVGVWSFEVEGFGIRSGASALHCGVLSSPQNGSLLALNPEP